MKKDFLYIAVIFAVLTVFLHKCKSDSSRIDKLIHNQQVANDSVQYYKNTLGQEVAEKQSYIGSNTELKELIKEKEQKNSQLRQTIRKFRKVTAVAKVETTTKIPETVIKFEEPISCSALNDDDFTLGFNHDFEHFSISGLVTRFDFTLRCFEVYNTQTIVFGKKRLGMFSTEYRTEITNSNPYIKVTGLDSYQFVEKQKRFGFSLFGGYVLTSNLTFTPAVGVGVTYDLIRF